MNADATTLEMALSDVAALAGVQRPVVSMWRTRTAGSDLPFPRSIRTERGIEIFDAHRVAAWLEATGRGNNADAAADLAAYASPAAGGAGADPSRFEALTSLLALRLLSGQALGAFGSGELLDLADEEDPDDAFLYRELERAEDLLPELADYADALADGAYNEAAAFETLLAGRFRSGIRGLADVALTSPAIDLIAGAAVELALQVDTEVFADPSLGGSDLLLGIAKHSPDPAGLSVITMNDDGGASRLARRRLRVHALEASILNPGQDSSMQLTGPAVLAAQYPSAGWPDMNAEEILAAIEGTHLQMDDQQRAVVLAPARVLCDALAGMAQTSGAGAARLRADLLRGGRVRAIIRLPQGLLRRRPREHQALWVLGPSFAEVEIGDRWTMVADLSGQELTPDVVQDLIGDVTASMGNHATVRAHSFRFARLVPTRSLLATKGSLVTTAAHTLRAKTPTGVAAAIRADELFHLLSEHGTVEAALPSGLTPAAGTAAPPLAIHELLAAGALGYLPGNRLAESAQRGGNTRVLGPAEVLGFAQQLDHAGLVGTVRQDDRHDPRALPPRSVDLLEFTSRYPGGRLTRPGDVVFCTSPRPGAVVDHQGGAVVVFPARVLRINATDPRGLHPNILAADINAQPPTAKDWRNWRLRTVPENQHLPLSGALAGIEHARRQEAQRLAWLDEFGTLIRDGVAGGSLSLPVRTTPPEGTR